MSNIQNITPGSRAENSIPQLDLEHGYFASASVTKSAAEVVDFCREHAPLERVLADLPEGIQNFLDLNLINVEDMEGGASRLTWENSPKSKVKGTLTFLVKDSPLKGGSIITAEAQFDKIKFKDDGPSTLMNLFLKRMKALMETGVIATTKGQPSGREELKTNQLH